MGAGAPYPVEPPGDIPAFEVEPPAHKRTAPSHAHEEGADDLYISPPDFETDIADILERLETTTMLSDSDVTTLIDEHGLEGEILLDIPAEQGEPPDVAQATAALRAKMAAQQKAEAEAEAEERALAEAAEPLANTASLDTPSASTGEPPSPGKPGDDYDDLASWINTELSAVFRLDNLGLDLDQPGANAATSETPKERAAQGALPASPDNAGSDELMQEEAPPPQAAFEVWPESEQPFFAPEEEETVMPERATDEALYAANLEASEPGSGELPDETLFPLDQTPAEEEYAPALSTPPETSEEMPWAAAEPQAVGGDQPEASEFAFSEPSAREGYSLAEEDASTTFQFEPEPAAEETFYAPETPAETFVFPDMEEPQAEEFRFETLPLTEETPAGAEETLPEESAAGLGQEPAAEETPSYLGLGEEPTPPETLEDIRYVEPTPPEEAPAYSGLGEEAPRAEEPWSAAAPWTAEPMRPAPETAPALEEPHWLGNDAASATTASQHPAYGVAPATAGAALADADRISVGQGEGGAGKGWFGVLALVLLGGAGAAWYGNQMGGELAAMQKSLDGLRQQFDQTQTEQKRLGQGLNELERMQSRSAEFATAAQLQEIKQELSRTARDSERTLRELMQGADQLESRLGYLEQQARSATPGAAPKTTASDSPGGAEEQALQAELKSLRAELEKLKTGPIPSTGATDLADLKSRMKDLTDSVKRLEDEMTKGPWVKAEQLDPLREEMRQLTQQAEKSAGEFKAQQKRQQEMEGELRRVDERLNQLGGRTASLSTEMAHQSPSEDTIKIHPEPVPSPAPSADAQPTTEPMAAGQAAAEPATAAKAPGAQPGTTKTEEKAAAEPKPKAPRTGAWGINLLSFNTRDRSEREQERLQKKGVETVIREANVKGATWYRLRVEGFANAKEAKVYVTQHRNDPDFSDAWVSKGQ